MSAQPTEGRPPEWDRMPWAARMRWEARQRQTRREQAQAQREAVAHQYDAQGRRIWTDAQMRTANRLRDRWRRCGGRELTPAELDAARAYDRARTARRRDTTPDPQSPFIRPPLPGSHTRHETLAEVLARPGMSAEDVCRELAMTPTAIDKALRRCDRQDLALPFWQYRKELQRRARTPLPQGDDEVEVRRHVLDGGEP